MTEDAAPPPNRPDIVARILAGAALILAGATLLSWLMFLWGHN